MRPYKHGDLSKEEWKSRGRQTFGIEPFDWQIDTAEAILEGRDVVLDVGTGSGKTMAFTLVLVWDPEDIAIIVSPLSSLMIEQMENAPISTIAVCRETFERTSKEEMFRDISTGKFRRVIVSPEIALSPEFGKSVLSKKTLQNRLRCFIVDEAHCIADWGSSFRTDYSKIGALRGRIRKSVPFVVASATLPTHVLDIVKKELNLDTRAAVVALTNERMNIALSVRVMQYEEVTKADLRFIIPRDATVPQDIPITLIYADERNTCETIRDQLMEYLPPGSPATTIAYYHALIGRKQKRLLEERLRKGEVRILVCTDAVGMGCDLRNIERVILWDLPRTFNSLVQRVGRAARNLSCLGEAILIVRKSTRKEGVTAPDVSRLQSELLNNDEGSHAFEFDADERMEIENVVDAGDQEIRTVEDGGSRVERINEGEREEAVDGPNPRKKAKSKSEQLEIAYLTLYANTSSCLRKVWDKYFGNKKKAPLVYQKNTLYKAVPGTRCCYNCDPDKFAMEEIELDKKQGLKRGRRTTVSDEFHKLVEDRLFAWRETLLDQVYEDAPFISAEYVLAADIIDKLASEGKRVSSATDLLLKVRWAFGTRSIQDTVPVPNEHASALFIELQDIYKAYDEAHRVDEDTEDELDKVKGKGVRGSGQRRRQSRRTAVVNETQASSSSSQLQFYNSVPSDYASTQ